MEDNDILYLYKPSKKEIKTDIPNFVLEIILFYCITIIVLFVPLFLPGLLINEIEGPAKTNAIVAFFLNMNKHPEEKYLSMAIVSLIITIVFIKYQLRKTKIIQVALFKKNVRFYCVNQISKESSFYDVDYKSIDIRYPKHKSFNESIKFYSGKKFVAQINVKLSPWVFSLDKTKVTDMIDNIKKFKNS